MQVISYVKKYNVFVVMILGIKYVIVDNLQWWCDFFKENVFIVVMNEDEVYELMGFNDLLMVLDMVLNWVDLVFCIVGFNGFYMVGYMEEVNKC